MRVMRIEIERWHYGRITPIHGPGPVLKEKSSWRTYNGFALRARKATYWFELRSSDYAAMERRKGYAKYRGPLRYVSWACYALAALYLAGAFVFAETPEFRDFVTTGVFVLNGITFKLLDNSQANQKRISEPRR